MKVKELAIIILMTIILILLGTKVEATTGKINSETVRLRREPNTSSTIIEQLDKDLEVEIIEEEDSWYKIKAKVNGESVTGYVSKSLVDTKAEENTTTPNEATKAPTESVTTVDQTNPEVVLYEDDVEPSTSTVDTTKEIQEKRKYTLERETPIKVIPLINAKNKSTLNGEVKVIEIINDWCKIENDTESGWVRKSSLQETTNEETVQQEQPVVEQETTPEVTETTTTNTTEKKEETTPTIKSISKTGYVTTESLMVRKEASTSSEDIESLSKNDKVEITGQLDGWYQIKINGKTGYVSSKYISDTKATETTSRSGSTIKEEKVTPMEVEEKTTNSTTSNTNKGTSVVEYAKNYLGCKYVSGGSSPTTGFDCSGFKSYVYKNFGVSLSRSSKGQINDGVAVSRSDLQPGDIVVFNNSGNSVIGHVGIYIGGDNFIHAANPSQGVTITSLSSSYYSKRYVGARRVN